MTDESTEDLARDYATKCQTVLAGANECLEHANQAIGAREQGAVRPQHEISINHFNSVAEEAERNLASKFTLFDQACNAARDSASYFLSFFDNPGKAEFEIGPQASDDVLDQVATAKRILNSNYGPTPPEYIRGLQETNAFIDDPSGAPGVGVIFQADPTPESGTAGPDNNQGASSWL